ncbi:MAG: sigma-70 family RNA polymerase sigma factor, partial [Candidatus Omnitrophota bacterium]
MLPRKDVLKAYYALCQAGKKPDLPHELVLNDIIAKAFELVLTRDNGYIPADKMSSEESAFLDKIEPVIRSNRHNYFTADFRDLALRGEKIRLALSRGYTFLQAANEEKIKFDPVGKEASSRTMRALPTDNDIILEQKLNLLKAYDGHELADDEIGLARTNVYEGRGDGGTCFVTHMKHKKNGKCIQFTIPEKYMDRDALRKFVIIKVVRDPNRKRVINVYFESDFISSEYPSPAVTYKYFPDEIRHYPSGDKTGICRPINLALMDIRDYRAGNTGIVPVEGRVLELTVRSEKTKNGDSFIASSLESFSVSDPVKFKLLPAANDIFDPEKKGQKAYARISEHPDYGYYIEVFKDNITLARYYYFKDMAKCSTADFEKMSMIDYSLGNKNVHGKPVTPTACHCKTVVTNKGELRLFYRGKKCAIGKLTLLAGKNVVLVPVKNKKYGYTILVHDASEYEKNRARDPDMILAKEDKTLIPLAILRAREYIDKGHFTIARDILERFIRKVPKNREARALLRKTHKLASPPLTEAEKTDDYLNFLADSVIDEREYDRDLALDYFKELLRDPARDTAKLAGELSALLDFSNAAPDRIHKNIAVLYILSKLPDELKTLVLARKAVKFLDYEGEYILPLRQAGLRFFKSIPEKPLFGIPKILTPFQGRPNGLERYRQDIAKMPTLTLLGEITLGVFIQCGDEKTAEAAKKQFIENNLHLVVYRALSYKMLIDINDLIGCGNLGLMRAVEKFEPQRGVKFATYAYSWIKAVMIRYIMDNRYLSRLPAHQHNSVFKYLAICDKKRIDPFIRDMSASQISALAEELEMTSAEVMRIKGMLALPASMDAPAGGADPYGTGTTLGDFQGTADENFKKFAVMDDLQKIEEKMEKIIRKKWRKHTERDIDIFRRRILVPLSGEKPDSLETIGRDYGVSRERIRQIEKNLLKSLKQILTRSQRKETVFSDYDTPAGSFKNIYKHFGFTRFNKVIDIDLPLMKKLGFVIMLKNGVYRLDPVFKGSDNAETEANIASVYNTRLTIDGKKIPLDRYFVPVDKESFVKARVKTELAHRFHLKARGTSIPPAPRNIRIWKDYAAPGQENMLTRIRSLTRNGPYKITFGELDRLVDSACTDGENDNSVNILPYDKLTDGQK